VLTFARLAEPLVGMSLQVGFAGYPVRMFS